MHSVYWYEGDLLQLVKYILLDILRMLRLIKCFIVDFGNIIIVYSYHIFEPSSQARSLIGTKSNMSIYEGHVNLAPNQC